MLPGPQLIADRARHMPPLEACHRARESRDARFDGLFFTAVRSTRVYCRSICPAPTCKRENVVYYPTAAAAQAAGYRPCLRCRPELAPGPNVDDDAPLRRAVVLITSGFLADASVDALAQEVGLRARHLRRRFVERLGATPLALHVTPGRSELQLDLFGAAPADLPALVQRVRRLFDLDADGDAMHRALSCDPVLAARIAARPGLRLPGAWEGFELAIAELVKVAHGPRDALCRVIGTHGQVHPGTPPGLGFVFPSADRLAVVELEALGIGRRSAQRIRTLALAVRDGGLHFGVGQEREAFVQRLRELARLPVDRAQWIALRALGDPDACCCWPPSAADAAARWRPWRAYAWLHHAVSRRPIEETVDA